MDKKMQADMDLLAKYGYKLDRINQFAKESGVSKKNLIISEANRLRANEMFSVGLINLERWLEIMAEIAIIQTPAGIEN